MTVCGCRQKKENTYATGRKRGEVLAHNSAGDGEQGEGNSHGGRCGVREYTQLEAG
jgi:hypothetical protein